MKSNSVIIVRVVGEIGIDKYANGYTLDGKPIKRSFYNGRLCYNYKGVRVGYATLKKSQQVRIEIKNNYPF